MNTTKHLIICCVLLFSLPIFSQHQPYYDATAANGNGFRFWNGNNSYKIHMGNSSEYKYGPVNDYSIKMNMNNDTDRGWTWGVAGNQPIAALNTLGDFQIAGNLNALGELGIGTAAPKSKLHVFDGASGHDPHAYTDLLVEDDENVLLLLMTQNDKNAYYGFGDTDDDFVGGIQYYHPTDMMYFRVNNHTADMVINKDGRVGIGTTTPNSKLDVRDGKIRVSDGNDRMYLAVDDQNSTSSIAFGDDLNDRLDLNFDFWNGTAQDITIMSLLANGKVGIGTTAPDAELAVNGNVHAKEVKVDLIGWPDYVFSDDYELPTLQEVEKHIKQRGHLINIPSAKEVEENGVQLGEMNKLLLEKIEELTLYTLKQEEKLQEQSKDIAELKTLIKTMINDKRTP